MLSYRGISHTLVWTYYMTKHGMCGTPTYLSWKSMLRRCDNPRSDNYHRYGGRGITVCQEWRESFVVFLRDMGNRPAGTSIDRIDNDGNYEPGNCRWATGEVQARNKGCDRGRLIVEFEGALLTVTQAARRIGMHPTVLYGRLVKCGWPLEMALSKPVAGNGEGSDRGTYRHSEVYFRKRGILPAADLTGAGTPAKS